MSITLGNGLDPNFGYFSLPGRRARGQQLHHCSKQSVAYRLPSGFLPGQWSKYPGLRSVRRGCAMKIDYPDHDDFVRLATARPMYFAHIAERPAGRFRLSHRRSDLRWAAYKAQAALTPNTEPAPTAISIQVTGETARLIEELAARCSEADRYNGGATSHGQITGAELLTMLAEDAAMVMSRPGSWEGANMLQVLNSHGYGF